MGKTFTLYRTDAKNALGGFMTFDCLLDAANSLKRDGAKHIYVRTFEKVRKPNRALCRLLWEDRIY